MSRRWWLIATVLTACNFSVLRGEELTGESLVQTCLPECAPGESCQFGKCVCDPGLCTGCCASERCLLGTEVEACGKNGNICQSCDPESAGPLCVERQCGCVTDQHCTASLSGPLCRADNRCGCANEQSCADGQTCTAGHECRATGCDAEHPCKAGCCLKREGQEGVCVASDGCSNGLSCGSDGLCPDQCDGLGKRCRTGCCTSGVCIDGTSPTGCGDDGGVCNVCAPGAVCMAGFCGCDDNSDCLAPQRCNTDTGQCTNACDATHPCNTGCCDNGTCVYAQQNAVDAQRCENVTRRPYCLRPAVGGPPECGCRDKGDCGDLVCDATTNACANCSAAMPCGAGQLCLATTSRCVAEAACDGCRDAAGTCYPLGWLLSSNNEQTDYCGTGGEVCQVVHNGQTCNNGDVWCTDSIGCNAAGAGTPGDPFRPFCNPGTGQCRACTTSDCTGCSATTGACVTCPTDQCLDGACVGLVGGQNGRCENGSDQCVSCGGATPICDLGLQRCVGCSTSAQCTVDPYRQCIGQTVGGYGPGECGSVSTSSACLDGGKWIPLDTSLRCRDGAGKCVAPCATSAPICDTSAGCRGCTSHAECGAGRICKSGNWTDGSAGTCVNTCTGCNNGTVCEPGTTDAACGKDGAACDYCEFPGCRVVNPFAGLCPTCQTAADCGAPSDGCHYASCTAEGFCRFPIRCTCCEPRDNAQGYYCPSRCN